MGRFSVFAVIMIPLSGALGCASARFAADTDAQRIRDLSRRPYAVCVGPIPTELAEGLPGDTPEAVSERIVEELRGFDAWETVELLGGDGASGLDALIEGARGRGCDLLLLARCNSEPRVLRSGHTGWFVPNLVFWFIMGPPSWWVRDLRHRVEWTVTWEIYRTGNGEKVDDVELTLNDDWTSSLVDRGWSLLAFLVPPSLTRTDPGYEPIRSALSDWLALETAKSLKEMPLDAPGVRIRLEDARVSREGEVLRQGLRLVIESKDPLEAWRMDLDHAVGWRGEGGLELRRPEVARAEWRYSYTIDLTEEPISLSPDSSHRIRILARVEPSAASTGRDGESWDLSQTWILPVGLNAGSGRDAASAHPEQGE